MAKPSKKEDNKKSSKYLSLLSGFGVNILKKDEEEKFPYIIKLNHIGLNTILGGGILGSTMLEISGPSGCLSGDTEISTPDGPVRIDKIKVGDTVYGYNHNGLLEETKVKHVFKTGVKKVTDLLNPMTKKRICSCTDDHRWPTVSESGKLFNITIDKLKQKSKHKIIRNLDVQMLGGISEPHAYVIGALLGNECLKQEGNRLYVSSQDNLIPNKIAKILNVPYVYRSPISNHTWILSTNEKNTSRDKSSVSDTIRYNYMDIIQGLGSSNKTFPIDIIDTWDTESKLNILAGLIDTDRSIFISDKKSFIFYFSSISKDLTNIVQYILYDVFKIDVKINVTYSSHYKETGCIYDIKVSNVVHSFKIIKEIDRYLVTNNKKYRDIYSTNLSQKTINDENKIAVDLGDSYETETYDIEIELDTHLYMLHNQGLITHNSSKSFILYDALASTLNMGGYCFLNDSEAAYKQSYGNKVGLIPDGEHFALTTINSMEDSFKAMRTYISYVRNDLGDKKSPITLGIDSYAGLRINIDLKNEEALKDPIGYMAMQTNMKFNELISKFIPFIKKHNATLVIINQLTAKYDHSPQGTVKTYQSLNEDKMAYFSTQRIRLSMGKIDGAFKKIIKLVPSISKYKDKLKKQIGVWVTAETIKNRLLEPFQKAEMRILYRSGIKNYSGLSELLVNRGYIKTSTKVAYNAKGEKLKTPDIGFKLIHGDTEKFYKICRKKENLPNKDVESAIKEVIDDNPEFLNPEYYEFDRDKDEDDE